MIDEYARMVNEMKIRVIPVGQDGLNEVLEETVHLKLRLRGPAEMEFYQNGELKHKFGPKVSSSMSREEFSEATQRWLQLELIPMLQRWNARHLKTMLPSTMAALSTLVGFDIEHFLVSTQRGVCNECQGRLNCGTADHFMWHWRCGPGVVIVTLEGLSVNEIEAPASPRPMFDIPKTAKVIAPTGCEAKASWALTETMRNLVNIFLNEATCGVLATAFGAEAAERGDVNKFLRIIGLDEVGLRIAESSAFREGSVAKAALQPYKDSQGAAEPLNNLNTQADWIFTRTMPKDLWAEIGAQEDFSLKKVRVIGKTDNEKFLNKLQRMAFIYHCLDNQMPLFLTQVAITKVLVSHPLVFLMGYDLFAQELTDVTVEMLGRTCVKGEMYFHAPRAHLPKTMEEVVKIVNSIHQLRFEDRCRAYRDGAYRLFRLDPNDMPIKKEIVWGSTWMRTGERSKPATVSGAGRKRKPDGFRPLQDGEVFVQSGGGCKIRMDQGRAQDLDRFDVVDQSLDGVGSQMGRNFVERQIDEDAAVADVDDDVVVETNTYDEVVSGPEKRGREANLDREPARKKFGAAGADEDMPHVGGRLNDDKVQLMRKLFPAMGALIRMVVETEEITTADFEVIFKDLQAKLTAVQTETHVKRISGLNDSKAAKYEAEMADERRRLQNFKKRMDDRNEDIKKLQWEQTQDKNAYEKRKLVLRKRESEEELRRKEFVKMGEAQLVQKQKNAAEAAQMLLDATLSKMSTSVPSTTATATPTIIPTLARIEGRASEEPVDRHLEGWINQEPYDISRSQVINLSEVVNLVMETAEFLEALETFNAMKNNENVGNLSGVGTALADIRRATSHGNASWVLCNARLVFLSLMKKAFMDTQDVTKKKELWTADQIAEAKPNGKESRDKKIADNRDIRGKRLVTELAIAFNQGVVQITGGNLYTATLWYDGQDFQDQYKGWFDEGQAYMARAAAAEGKVEYRENHKKGKARMEALMASRQRAPVKAEHCKTINKCFATVHGAQVEFHEEEVDDGDVQMNAAEAPEVESSDVQMDEAGEDVQEQDTSRLIVEVDEEERGRSVRRGPAHLQSYRDRK